MLAPVTQLQLRTISLESRRSGELARLLERHGIPALQAPSLREVPLTDQTAALEFGEALFAHECDVLVLLTGVGARALIGALQARWPAPEIIAALSQVVLACRGPKPVALLKELGLRATVTAPEPNTWRELLGAMETLDLSGQRVWVQEYGRPHPELVAGLAARGARVRSAAVYAWQLPEDLGPLQRGIAAICDGDADAIVFTAAQQIEHVLEVAQQLGLRDRVLSSLRARALVASIGPVTTAALAEHGIRVDIEPEHPKMGHLVKALVERGMSTLAHKRAAI
jgi:uroporphyrinogen-III synthase